MVRQQACSPSLAGPEQLHQSNTSGCLDLYRLDMPVQVGMHSNTLGSIPVRFCVDVNLGFELRPLMLVCFCLPRLMMRRSRTGDAATVGQASSMRAPTAAQTSPARGPAYAV